MRRAWARLQIALSWWGAHPGHLRCPVEIVGYRCMRSFSQHHWHYYLKGATYMRWNFGSAE